VTVALAPDDEGTSEIRRLIIARRLLPEQPAAS
jgi:hypothetical protein